MARRNESPEKKRRRELIGEFLKENPLQGMNDINELVKELISQVIEKGLEDEMEDELGYSKYDYKNKETDNCRNGYSSKTLSTSFGEMDIDVPRDHSQLYR